MISRFHIPIEGRCWLVVATIFLVIGWFKALNLILLLAFLMLVMAGLNVLAAGRGLEQLQIRRRIEQPVFAGSPFQVEIQLHNSGERTLLGIQVEDAGASHRLGHFQVQLAPGETVIIRRMLSLPNRCCYSFGPVRVWSGLPFGLVRRQVEGAGWESVPVFPRLGRLHHGRLQHFLHHSAAGLQRSRSVPRAQQALAADFHGLRAFRSGDSPRWIHWRTSARRNELMVRELEPPWVEDLVIVLEPWLPEYLVRDLGQASPDDPSSGAARQLLEDAISLTATLCWQLGQQPGRRLTLAIAGFGPVVVEGGSGLQLAGRMLEALAELKGSAVVSADALQERLGQSRRPIGPVLLITTRTDSELPALLQAHYRRPIVTLQGPALADADFYERPRHPTRPPETPNGVQKAPEEPAISAASAPRGTPDLR